MAGATGQDAGSVAQQFERLWQQYLWIGVAVGAAVLLYMAWMLVRFRHRGEDADARGALRRDRPAPWWVTAATVAAIALILFPLSLSTMGTHEQMEHPPEGDALRIQVTAFRFGWLFQYPEGFQTLNDLRFPLGTNVVLDIRSQDVMHKFHIAAYHVGIDAMPGHPTQAWFRTDDPAPTALRCAELCGFRHALMVATVQPLDATAYDAWVAGQVAGRASGLTQSVRVLHDGTALQPELLRTIAGAPTRIEFTNQGDRPLAFRLGGPAAGQTPLVEPGGTAWLNVTVAQPGDALGQAVDAQGAPVGAAATLRALAPVEIDVSLEEFRITARSPSGASPSVGAPVVFRVANDGSMPHDLAVGAWDADEPMQRLEAKSVALGAGESTALAYWPGAAGPLDLWCTVAGHAQLGMRSSLEVQA